MNRYEPRSYQTLSGDFVAVMDRDDNGAYITYSSHKHEIEHLQARLKALESTQKHQISAPSILAEHIEQAIKEVVGNLVHEAYEQLLKDLPKYNGDPCHSAVDSILDDLAVGPGKTVKSDYPVADELTKGGKTFTFGTNFGEGKALTMSTAKMEPRSGGYGYGNRHVWAVGECESACDRKVAVCYHVNGNEFINGCEYEYEISESFVGSPRLIYITQDAFVSGLKGDYRWEAKRIGKVMNAKATICDSYAIVNPDGGVVAQFYIK